MKFPTKNDRIYETPYGKLPSVTTVIGLLDKSGPLMGWAVKTMAEYLKSLADKEGNIIIKKAEAEDIFKRAKAYHKEVSQTAKDIGSEVHNAIEVHLKGQRVNLKGQPEEVLNGYDAFLKWKKENGLKVVATERKICSALKYAGTLDLIAELKGVLYLVDFKTSKAIYDDYIMQVAAYRQASQEGMYCDNGKWEPSSARIKGVGILRLDKTTGLPEWKTYALDDIDRAFEKFKDLLNYWWKNNQNNNQEKEVSDGSIGK